MARCPFLGALHLARPARPGVTVVESEAEQPRARGDDRWRPLRQPRGQCPPGLGLGRGDRGECPGASPPCSRRSGSCGPPAPQRPPPAPPASAAAAAPRANGRWRPARAARRGLAPAARERPRLTLPRRGGEVSPASTLPPRTARVSAGLPASRAAATSARGRDGRGGALRPCGLSLMISWKLAVHQCVCKMSKFNSELWGSSKRGLKSVLEHPHAHLIYSP
ncbi:actin nucleation-promoting factor WAS-like [Moschus berezovskii]|uniref:actin nucleation-promoting factor WAS-like n=1 Tax=Moschus berezovskii TaxID=68408 RepID=UPI0024439C41|nr:actin nucleation-promoting factor WAS-like [Moschus berezovskii]